LDPFFGNFFRKFLGDVLDGFTDDRGRHVGLRRGRPGRYRRGDGRDDNEPFQRRIHDALPPYFLAASRAAAARSAGSWASSEGPTEPEPEGDLVSLEHPPP